MKSALALLILAALPGLAYAQNGTGNATEPADGDMAMPDDIPAPTLDGGVFMLLAGAALLCFVFAFRYSTALVLVTVVVLFLLSAVMFAQYDVTFTAETAAGSDTFVTTHCMICGSQSFAGWILFTLAILVSLIFFRMTITGESR